MEDDPDKINDPDRQLAAKVVAKGKEYHESRVRSRDENAIKAKGRKEIADLGFRTDAYQHSLRVSRDLTPKEQKDYVRDFRFFLKVFGDNQADLWPEEAAKAAARAQKRAAKAAKAKESDIDRERRLAADSPRSDPARGGAGGAKGRGKAKDAPAKAVEPKVTGRRGKKGSIEIVSQTGVTTEESSLTPDKPWPDDEAAAANAAQEQEVGDALLTGHIDAVKAAAGERPSHGLGSVADEVPISQSEKSAAALAKAGLA